MTSVVKLLTFWLQLLYLHHPILLANDYYTQGSWNASGLAVNAEYVLWVMPELLTR